jgi:hypothetical protein
MYCISCWIVPNEGDFVSVLEPPAGETGIERGAIGKVLEIENLGLFRRRFLVEFSGNSDRSAVRHEFHTHQIQATGFEFNSSIPVSLHAQIGKAPP